MEGAAMSEEEDYEFEYSDDDEGELQDDDTFVQIENQYYSAKGAIEDDPAQALKLFDEVVEMEEEKGKWGFKALKQIVKINYTLRNFKEMLTRYRQQLGYLKSAVTPNESEKMISSLLDYVSHSSDTTLLQEFYEITLAALKAIQNERLWFKTNLKLAKLYYKQKEYPRAARVLKELHESCKVGGQDNLKKGTQLLEVYALEIQLYTATKNTKKLKALYERALQIKSGVPHPRIMGVIRECGGKAHFRERDWQKAFEDFTEAFKNYDEAGHKGRIRCLKYLALANMIGAYNGVSPFDSVEAKVYSNNPEVLAFMKLVTAYEQHEIPAFEKILKDNWNAIMGDLFIRTYIEDLLRSLRTQALLNILRPYTRIRIPYLSKELNVPPRDVEDLLVNLILDNKIVAHIDQVQQLLVLHPPQGDARYSAVDRWASHLGSLQNAIVNKVA